MDLTKLHKQKIVDEICKCYDMAWSVLIHDNISSEILNRMFKRSDLLEYRITSIFSILDDKKNWDLPAIYFVNCTKEIARKINQEFKEQKFSMFQVFSLCEPVGLDPLIKCTVVNLEMKAYEERVFECSEDKMLAVANVLNGKFIISFIDITQGLAEKINNICQYDFPDDLNSIFLLVLDRTIDLYTPLMHFLTFRSVICEIGKIETKDSYYKEIRDLYLGKVGDHLKSSTKILTESLDKLKTGKVDIETLSSMVLETPKNIETKNNIQKYAGILTKCLSYFEKMKEFIFLEQTIILGEDVYGNKTQITLDSVLSQLVSPGLTSDEKIGLMFLLKAKGIIFTDQEKKLLLSKGFSREDLEIIFKSKNQIIRQKQNKGPNSSISRYTPVLYDIAESFITKKTTFQTLNITDIQVDSLRRSTMFTSSKPPRKIIVIYMKNGLSIEEASLANRLSKDFGIEVIIGTDKILSRSEFVEEYRKNKNLQELNFIKKG